MSQPIDVVDMTLEYLFQEQERFNRNFLPPVLGDKERVRWTKEYLLHLMAEFPEVLNEFSWKIHRPGETTITRSNLREELTDMFKYWLSIWVLWGFGVDDLLQEFDRKSEVVNFRYQYEQALASTQQPIAIVDIDGVLADYPMSFAKFVSERTNKPMPQVRSYDIGADFALDPRTKVRLKHQYRELGIKMSIDANPYASELVTALHKLNYFVAVVSNRPYAKYKRIYADTVFWLMERSMNVDSIAFTDDKQLFVLNLLDRGQKVAFAIEDHAGNANAISELGVKVFLVTRPYNEAAALNKNVHRVENLEILTKWGVFGEDSPA